MNIKITDADALMDILKEYSNKTKRFYIALCGNKKIYISLSLVDDKITLSYDISKQQEIYAYNNLAISPIGKAIANGNLYLEITGGIL